MLPFAICAIFKNEACYLKEWIEFHRLFGFERFYLYQNNSEDNWLPVLGPYIWTGIAKVINWPFAAPCQLQAYEHFIRNHALEVSWAAFLDCDEFLFSPSCATVSESFSRLPCGDYGAVGVNWLCFGSSGQEVQTEELVIERFNWRPSDDFAHNLHIKSVVRMNRVISAGPDPHHFRVRGGTVNERGENILSARNHSPTRELLRINHYFTKSRQEFIDKVKRGRADDPGGRQPVEFEEFQTAGVQDFAIWRFLTALKWRIASSALP